MFKQTIVAASLLAFAATSVAETLTSSATDSTAAITAAAPSIQAIATADDVSVPANFLHLDANLAVGDTIAVTYSGAALDEAYTHPATALVVSQTAGGAGAACVIGNQAVNFAGLSGSTATYRVNATDGLTVNCALALPVLQLDGASLATADTFSMTIATSTPFGVIQNVAATELVNVGAAELTSVVAGGFNEVVQVAGGRVALGAATDVATFTLADGGGGATLAATSSMTVTGDFSWAAQTTAGVTTFPGVVVTGGQTAAQVTTASSVTWTMTGAGTATLTLTPPTALVAGAAYPQIGTQTLSPATYGFSSVIQYTNEDGVAVAGGDSVTGAAGAWTMDGGSVVAYGIPNSASVTPFLWVQNNGTLAGAITVDVTCDGVITTGIDAGTAAANSNTSIGAAVQTAVDALATCGAGSRYDAAITVNATQANITVNAGYKVANADGSFDRLSLETSDSLDGDDT